MIRLNLKFRLSLLALCALTPSMARADILFIDFNWSTKEIKAAQQAAEIRGEKVIVLPELPSGVREELRAYWDQISPGRNKVSDAKKEIGALKTEFARTQSFRKQEGIREKIENLKALIKKITQRDKTLNDEYEALRSKHVQYKGFSKLLRARIAEMAQDSTLSISSVVVSGHHAEKYFGEAGELSLEQIAGTLKAHPEMIKNLDSIYAWNCYSANPDQATLWRKQFPEIDLFGFDNRSPSQRNPVDSSYLKTMLLREKRAKDLADRKAREDLAALLRQIPGLNDRMGVQGAVCINDYYFSASHGMENFGTNSAVCSPDQIRRIKQEKTGFDHYFLADQPDYEDVPANTGNSELRSFYTLARQMKACPQVADITGLADQAANLVFFKEVEGNFALKYSDEIERLNDVLSSMDSSIDVRDLHGQISRKQVLEIAKKLDRVAKKLPANTSQADAALVDTMNRRVNHLLVRLECIPSTWIDAAPNASTLVDPAEECLAQ